MSASKRRKLEEGREVPKSALSALSARRQLAAAAVLQETSSSIEEAPKQRAGNQFSVLQRAAQADRGSPKSPCTARSVATRQGTTSKRSTEKGEATPESGASTPKVASYSSFRLNKQNYKKAKDGHCELRLSDSELCTSEDAPKKSIIQELNSPAEWNKAISDITSSAAFDQRAQSSTLVCGPKGAGKSTFSKLLTNRLLTTTNRASTAQPGPGVAVIDLDPGQPEYALAGTVSLVHITRPNLGTPFSHPGFHHAGHRILRSHALASVSPAMSPSLYIQCAMDLYEAYRRTLRNCPLLINTPGWILGTGLDLLVDLITKILPSRVIYMSEDGPFDVIDGLRSATRNEFLTMPSRPSEYTARTGSHLRAMQAMAYFHLADNSAASSLPVLSWDPRPISSMPPWEVRYASKRKGIRGILSYDHQSPPELFRAAIDGMVVAVVEIEDVEAFRNIIDGYDLESRQPDAVKIAASKAQIEHSTAGKTTTKDELRTVVSPEGLPMISNAYDATLDPRYCQAIGLALVRGIDTVSKTLQLISPITGSQIQSARSQGHDIILVHGKFDAPTWAYAEDFFYQRGTASLGSKAEQRDLDVTYEGTDEDGLNAEPDDTEDVNSVSAVPWLEILQGNQKRPVGSGVWRVRRDLGRNTGD
ncbi:hypothetical protein MY5147_006996 [Beauveria neobassiana]